MLAKATIVAKYINPPKEGAKNATVKDDRNNIWLLDPANMSQLREGEAYNIEYDQFKVKSGDTLRKIERWEIKGAALPAQTNKSSPIPNVAPIAKDEQIFVQGIVQRIKGRHGEEDLSVDGDVALVNHWREVWQRTFGGKPSIKDDLNDEIPF